MAFYGVVRVDEGFLEEVFRFHGSLEEGEAVERRDVGEEFGHAAIFVFVEIAGWLWPTDLETEVGQVFKYCCRVFFVALRVRGEA